MTEALTLDPTAPRHVTTPLAVLAAAVIEVGDRDDELPLRPEETTS